MNKIVSILTFCFFINFFSIAQNNLNDYKYVIVPDQFEFQKGKDQYQLNSLTRFLFNKYGFEAYNSNETLPEELKNNPCLGLNVNVLEDNSLFKTKLQIELINCQREVIATSKVGESREKDYEKAYNLALRDAFGTYQQMNHKYEPSESALNNAKEVLAVKNATDAKQDSKQIEQLKEEIKTLKLNQSEKTETRVPTVAEKPVKTEKVAEDIKGSLPLLYAQQTENGYNVVDASSKIIYQLVYSGKEDVYIVKGKDAVFYKINNSWVIAESTSDAVKIKSINIKF